MSCAYYVLLVTIFSCIILSIFTNVLYYWSVVGFILFIPYLSFIIFQKSHIVIFQLSYGLAFLLLLTVNSVLLPLTIFWLMWIEKLLSSTNGNKVKQISNFRKINEVEDIIFTDYRIASLYGFHSGRFTNVDALMQNRETQFDIWRSKKQFYPKNL